MRHFVPALKQFSAAQLWNKRSADYLYGLALVHFNDMEVKAVDSFSRGQKNWFKREVVSYIHKNLRERKKKKKKKQRKPLWKGVYIAGTSTKASTSMGIKYINIKFRRHYCVDQTRPCSHTNWVCDTVFLVVFFFCEKAPDVNPAVNLPPTQETENDAWWQFNRQQPHFSFSFSTCEPSTSSTESPDEY